MICPVAAPASNFFGRGKRKNRGGGDGSKSKKQCKALKNLPFLS